MDPTGRQQDVPPQPQVLSLGHEGAKRVLEAYVKRSLSLCEGRAKGQRPGPRPRKWVPLEEKSNRVRRHSSDTSAHLHPDEVELVIAGLKPTAPTEGPTTEGPPGPRLESSTDAPTDGPMDGPAAVFRLEASLEQKQDDSLPKKDSKKNKKPSIFKSFLNLFSRKGSDRKETRTSSPERTGSCTPADTPSPSLTCLPGLGPSSGVDHASPRPSPRRSLRKKLSRRRLSFTSRGLEHSRRSLRKTSAPMSGDQPDGNRAYPESLYYEKVSEELEKIVKEVKDERQIVDEEAETIEKIVNLLKQKGDAIDKELKLDEGGVGSLLNSLSYVRFQQLADLYVESGTPSQLAPGPQTAPELVKYAFTLDFTGLIANLSSLNNSRIVGFGNQYLQERFTQMSAAQGTETHSRKIQTINGPD